MIGKSFLAFAFLSACTLGSTCALANMPCDAQDPGFVVLGQFGTVQDCIPLHVSGLEAWHVRAPNQTLLTMYTTADAKAFFAGMGFTADGKPLAALILSQTTAPKVLAAPPKFIVPAPPVTPGYGTGTPAIPENLRTVTNTMPTQIPLGQPSSQQSGTSTGNAPAMMAGLSNPTRPAMSGTFSGPIPEPIKTLDGLKGFTEGAGGPADTLFIIIDPRCPHCQEAYVASRPYLKGHTIKWIPTTALGDPKNGTPVAATILQSDSADVIARVLGKHEPIATTATPQTIDALDASLAFLYAAFKESGYGSPGVPAGFYLDHRTGTPRMTTGVAQPIVLQDIFGVPSP